MQPGKLSLSLSLSRPSRNVAKAGGGGGKDFGRFDSSRTRLRDSGSALRFSLPNEFVLQRETFPAALQRKAIFRCGRTRDSNRDRFLLGGERQSLLSWIVGRSGGRDRRKAIRTANAKRQFLVFLVLVSFYRKFDQTISFSRRDVFPSIGAR